MLRSAAGPAGAFGSAKQLWTRPMAVPSLDKNHETSLAAAHDQLGSRELLPFGERPRNTSNPRGLLVLSPVAGRGVRAMYPS